MLDSQTIRYARNLLDCFEDNNQWCITDDGCRKAWITALKKIVADLEDLKIFRQEEKLNRQLHQLKAQISSTERRLATLKKELQKS